MVSRPFIVKDKTKWPEAFDWFLQKAVEFKQIAKKYGV